MNTLLSTYERQWNGEINPAWGVTGALNSVISQLDLARPGLLPNLRHRSTLLLTCDYSGQHKKATYEALSFLLADLSSCGLWNSERKRVRERFLRDRRRMSYKGMNDRRRRAALIPFLSAANYISGILLTVLVEKRLLSELQVEEDYLPPTLRAWPATTVRKFLWVIHSGALLLAGLSAPGQNLFWITDQDEIAANNQRIIDATPFVAGITSGYLSHSLGHLRFGTTACDCGDLLIEDAAAIPDLAAGALSEIPNVGVVQQTSRILTPMRGHISQKALVIGAWVGVAQRHPLRRLSLIVDHGDFPRTVRARALDLPSEW